MQAVVLAAGEGQRLRPFTVNKPKVMIKIGNRPVLEYVIESLRNAGIRDIVMVVGYRRSRVMDYFGDGSRWNVKIEYAIQEKQLGTAHALKQAESLVEDDFVVVSGDNIFDSETVKKLEKWSVAFKRSEEVSKYGVLDVVENRVKRVIEKPEKPVSGLINTGMYRFGGEIFDFIADITDIPSVINRMIEAGYEFLAVEAGKWLDIVYPWDILKINEIAMDFRGVTVSGRVENAEIVGNVSIGSNSVIKHGAFVKDAVIGRNCEVGQNTVIKGRTSIGDNVRIGALCYIENSVIGDNVVIGPHSYIKDSVIDSGCVLKAKFTAISDQAAIIVDGEVHHIRAGAFIGENCSVGGNVVIEAGSIIGNSSKISSGKVVSGKIPDDSMVV